MGNPQSRNEAILQATLDGTEYTDPPQSRIESLLIELKAVIETGKTNYSTDETLTGQKWIDGRPIYSKVIDIGALPDTTTKSVAHNITNLDLCISIVGVVKNSTSRLTIPSVWNSADETIGIYANSTNVIVSASKNRSSFSGYAILEYVKATS